MRETVYGSGGLMQRGNHWLGGHVRLAPGVTPQQAEAELTAISAQLTREFSHADDYSRAELVPVWKEGGGQMLAPVILLLMAVRRGSAPDRLRQCRQPAAGTRRGPAA